MLVCLLDRPPRGPQSWPPLGCLVQTGRRIEESGCFLLGVSFPEAPQEMSLLVLVAKTAFTCTPKPTTDRRNRSIVLYLDRSPFTWCSWGRPSLPKKPRLWIPESDQGSISREEGKECYLGWHAKGLCLPYSFVRVLYISWILNF